ncbi:MAG: hypothetical protein ACRDRX_18750 [Pseudonocardiaceae bacterium]
MRARVSDGFSYVLNHGQVIANGSPAGILTAELVANVFGVQLRLWTDPDTHRTHLSFDRLATQDTPAVQTPVAP